MGGKRNWTIEDNVVALYIALHGYAHLQLGQSDIKGLIGHKGFQMRVQNYRAIETQGGEGLNAGLNSPTFNALYQLFRPHNREWFSNYVNLVLETRLKLSKPNGAK